MKQYILLVVLIGMILVTAGCTKTKTISIEPTEAKDLLLKDSDYATSDLTDVSNEALSLAAGSAVGAMTENPGIGVAAQNRFNVFADCAKDEGVHVIQGYMNTKDPQSVGIMAIGEENQDKLLKCLVVATTGGLPAASIVQTTKPRYGICGASYKVESPAGKKYYITFLGTSNIMCIDFCNNQNISCNYNSNVGTVWIWEAEEEDYSSS